MIKVVRGDLFASNSEALVNTVNCVGVMGKGIALEFKKRFPEYYESYRKICLAGRLRPGSLHVYKKAPNPILIGFPTKDDWKNPSKIEWIETGLISLRAFILEKNIQSISIPALGCSNGKLEWNDVRPLIEKELRDIPCQITLFEPNT